LKERKPSNVLCNAKVSLKLKGKFYWTTVRLKMLHETKCWTVKNQQKYKLSVVETMMLCWMCAKTKQDKI